MAGSSTVSLSTMRDVDSFKNSELLDSFLALQLDRGALAIVLGAGVSIPLGLPDWKTLVEGLATSLGLKIKAGLNDDEQAESLLHDSGLSEFAFAEKVREVLYTGLDTSFRALLKSPFLAALGALAMPSRRGSANKIITFNFDDLLETYLAYYGFSVEAVHKVPVWNSRSDIRVFHPHGVLPSDISVPIERRIVLTRGDYDRVVGDNSIPWHATLTQILASHTCIFLGVSGADPNLSNLLMKVQPIHSATENKLPYWGIRVSDDPNDARLNAWATRGVFQKTVSSYNELVPWMVSLCQRAARTYVLA